MALSAQKTFENIKKIIKKPSDIDYITKPSHGSANPNCESSFIIYMKKGTGATGHLINTSTIKKSKLIIALLENWRKTGVN